MYFELSDFRNNAKLQSNHFISTFAITLVFIALFHHFILCFINTNFFNVNGSWLVLTELSLVGMIFFLFIRDSSINYVLLLLFIISNALVLAIFQQAFDPKQVRNFIVPVLLIWLGSKYDHKISVDRLVIVASFTILIIGLFEMFFSEIYQEVFNISNFLISTGRVEESATEYIQGNFSANGTRYGGRNLLSFLGDHRVASVFLETVTVSNFASVVVAWGLSKNNFKDAWVFVLVGSAIALLADSRFGMTVLVLLVILRLAVSLIVNKAWLKYTAYLMPIILIIICLYVGKDFTEFRDDFETRIGSTGDFILNFKPLEFFGLSSYHYHALLDQGYARLLHYNGLVLGIVLWVSYCRLKLREDSENFKYFVAVIISTNLAISGDSIFSFKWVAFMWFLIGTQLYVSPKTKF